LFFNANINIHAFSHISNFTILSNSFFYRPSYLEYFKIYDIFLGFKRVWSWIGNDTMKTNEMIRILRIDYQIKTISLQTLIFARADHLFLYLIKNTAFELGSSDHLWLINQLRSMTRGSIWHFSVVICQSSFLHLTLLKNMVACMHTDLSIILCAQKLHKIQQKHYTA
jgi:hypothetical protein